jgi:hypothetical protein
MLATCSRKSLHQIAPDKSRDHRTIQDVTRTRSPDVLMQFFHLLNLTQIRACLWNEESLDDRTGEFCSVIRIE